LNDSREYIAPVAVPVLKKQKYQKEKATLSVIISSVDDIDTYKNSAEDIYFQLPNSFNNEHSSFADLFNRNKKITPWFPSVLIGEDYIAAIKFLQQIKPKQIVTNNTGIAYKAYKLGIPWIAGPFLNMVNSYSLLCLKENFNCSGAFISNEISKDQMMSVKKPEGFKLFYSIYHPIELMTSRQCLFHQVIGCNKSTIDDSCLQQCEKLTSLTNLKKDTFSIEKKRGNYHKVYNTTNLLNTDIMHDMSNRFNSFFIDLRDIKTATKFDLDKAGIIKLFNKLLNGSADAPNQLKQHIHPTDNSQYKRGI